MTNNINALLEHLGIEATFIATQNPPDIEEFCTEYPDKVLGITFVAPYGFNPEPFKLFNKKTMFLKSEFGVTVDGAARAKELIDDLVVFQLNDYDALPWSDICVDRPEPLCRYMSSFFSSLDYHTHEYTVPHTTGNLNGVSYKVSGAGPVLILTPFFLAAKQWHPVLEELAKSFTVIIIGGSDFGGVPVLENRASLPTYQAMLSTLISNMVIPNTGNVLEIGCGTAALCRHLLRLKPELAVVGADINEYLLGEGAALAEQNKIAINCQFQDENFSYQGKIRAGELTLTFSDATEIKFPDNYFDAVFSVTALEECDASKALKEIRRILKPGGVAGIVIRALDMPLWWNLDVSKNIENKINIPPQAVSETGVADKSLYKKMEVAGFNNLIFYPFIFTATGGRSGLTYDMYRNRARQLLNKNERSEFDEAAKRSGQDNQLFLSIPLHCCLGWK